MVVGDLTIEWSNAGPKIEEIEMITEKLNPRNFEGQFGCITEGKCPQQHPENNGDLGCTFWWEQEQISDSGERRIVAGCAGSVLLYSIDDIIMKQGDYNRIMQRMSEDVVNRVGQSIANNAHKLGNSVPENQIAPPRNPI